MIAADVNFLETTMLVDGTEYALAIDPYVGPDGDPEIFVDQYCVGTVALDGTQFRAEVRTTREGVTAISWAATMRAAVDDAVRKTIKAGNIARPACDRCKDTGCAIVPSMLGYGTEDYPCNCAAGQALSEEEREGIEGNTRAWIDCAIR